jgi:thymidylate synthase
MNKEEQSYLDLMKNILENGTDKSDRTGIGTKSIFGAQLRFSLEDGQIPLLTTKKMFIKGIIEELLFFIRGETNTKKLEEKGVNIWKGNTSRQFLDKRGLYHYPEGEMGPMYGSKWRNFNGVDQLTNALELIKNDPHSRRIIITAYDPSASNLCVLDPCHYFQQYYVANGKLSCQFNMRSTDCFLGLGFNLASYAILNCLMAKASGLEPGELLYTGTDVHIYKSHIEQVKEQLKRDPYPFPKISIEKNIRSVKDMEQLCFDDFKLMEYSYHSAIKADMAI